MTTRQARAVVALLALAFWGSLIAAATIVKEWAA